MVTEQNPHLVPIDNSWRIKRADLTAARLNLQLQCYQNYWYWNSTAIPGFLKYLGLVVVLQPVAQPYGQVRTDWNHGCIIDWSLSFPAGHKPFTCSHSVLRNTWLNIHAIRWMRLRFSSRFSVHVFTISQNLACASLFSSVVPWASYRLADPLTVFCDMIAAV